MFERHSKDIKDELDAFWFLIDKKQQVDDSNKMTENVGSICDNGWNMVN